MSTAIVPLAANLPAHIRARQMAVKQTVSELSGGVQSSFPIISYKGKVWRIKKGGDEVPYLDRDGDPIPSIEVVMVRAGARPSKTYYEKKYEEGMNEAPRCWSTDGLKPDSSVTDPIHPTCAACPKSQWGSAVTDQGKKSRACSDVRRVAVVFYNELQKKGDAAHVFLLRVPPASLNPLKDYAEKVLGPAQLDYFTLATRLGFDSQAAFPKMTFRVATSDGSPKFLTEDELHIVEKMRDSEDVHRMLSEGQEYAAAGTTGEQDAAPAAVNTAAQNDTPAPAATSVKAAEAEDVDFDEDEAEDEEPEVVEEDEDEDEVTPPPPPPKKAKKKGRPKKVEAPVETSAAPVKTPTGDADDLLDQLLAD